MRRFTAACVALAMMPLSLAFLVGACSDSSGETSRTDTSATSGRTLEGTESPVKRGEYLVTIGGCNDCHTPWKMGASGPEPDMSRMLSGHPEDVKMPEPPAHGSSTWGWSGAVTNTSFAGPWGTSYAMNLTPDSLTGIGTWTVEMFMKTIRSGKHWGTSRPIMPPMPWQNYRLMKDEDMKAVYAFLRSIPPVRNNIHPYTPPAIAEAK